MVKIIQSRTIRCQRELIDVTSLHRPDTGWRMVDAQGHEHRWFSDGHVATSYNPTGRYETPTLVWVKDGEEYWEDDDEPHAYGHLECVQCGEHIEPAYTSDAWTRQIPGAMKWSIDDAEVDDADAARAAFVNSEPLDLVFSASGIGYKGRAIVTRMSQAGTSAVASIFSFAGVSVPEPFTS